jgi:hypothetical protein
MYDISVLRFKSHYIMGTGSLAGEERLQRVAD